MKEYALYKGEEILSIGTIKEIAEDLGIQEETVKHYGKRAYLKKLERRKNCRNARLLIKLDDEE